MANNEIKTNAEIYREQRKERLAKAAKKKSSPKRDKAIRVAVKAIVIVLAAAVVLLGAGRVLTNVFCVPQKVLNVATYGDEKLTAAEFNYYYMYLYNQIAYQAQQYQQQYGISTGFDVNVSPADQEYVGSDAPEGVKTWADYFAATAPTTAFFYNEMYKLATGEEAKAKGFTWSEEECKSQLEETIAEIETKAKEADFSVDKYISRFIAGEGITEKSYKEIFKKEFIVQAYLKWYQENSGSELSDAEVKSYYAEHKDDFAKATARVYGFSYAKPAEDSESTAPVYTKAQAQKLANEFLSKITDGASFVKLALTYAPEEQKAQYEDSSATLLKNQSKTAISGGAAKIADWLFDAARKTGDKVVINEEDSEMFYVIYLESPAAPDTSYSGVSVRHILVEAATKDEGGETLSDEAIAKNFAAAKKEADAILKEWKTGEHTEDSFAALATEKTDDPGSKETGGLYSGINADSQYVENFLNWAMDATHKPGDTGIIKTNYGYHIMYYVGAEDTTPKWITDIKTTVAGDNFNELVENSYADIDEKMTVNEKLLDYFADRFIKNVFVTQ